VALPIATMFCSSASYYPWGMAEEHVARVQHGLR